MLNENDKQINFDDKTYEELVSEAIEQIPLLTENWTDFNAHDPGIMLLELFSWLTESQRYYLNEITPEHKLKYLKLLGIDLKAAEPARLPVVFSPANANIKRGAQTSIGSIPFSLEESIELSDCKIEFKHSLLEESLSIYGFMPFKENPHEGDCFYIVFDKAPPSRIRFYFSLLPPSAYNRTPSKEGFDRLASLRFDIEHNGEWVDCKHIDKTYGFMQSGEIAIDMPFSTTLIKCTLASCEIDIPPMFERVYPFYTELAQYNEVYGNEKNEWLKEKGYIVATLKQAKDGFLKVSASEADLTVYADEPYRINEYHVKCNKIELNTSPLIILESNFLLLVAEEDGVYREWRMVKDLSCSLPYERHYVLDNVKGVIYFGDNVHGKSAKSAIVASMRLSYANVIVKANNIFTIGGVSAFNPFSSCSGCAPESPEDAFTRINLERQKPYRAVTCDDYKELVFETPGLCIDNVNVYSQENGKINICIKSPNEKLNRVYLNNIRRHINPRKLACMEIQITSPTFWECAYYARIVPQDWALDKESEIIKFIEEYFCRLQSRFGLIISLPTWIKDLQGCPFIKKVDGLSLRRRNGDIVQEHDELTLPPDGLLRFIDKEIMLLKAGNN